ncbi:hypothetical protein Tco_0617113 [Tanacetum coccineum]
MASSHPKDTYFYYLSCIDDPKKHYRFKPGLLGHNGSLGVDFLNMKMIEDDWGLESKEVSFLGKGLNSPVRTKEVEKETHHLEHIIQQPIFLHVTSSHNNGVYHYYHPHLNSSVGERSKNFRNKHPALVEVKDRMDDEGEVTCLCLGLQVIFDVKNLRKFHWMILGGRFNQLSHVSSSLLSKPGEY